MVNKILRLFVLLFLFFFFLTNCNSYKQSVEHDLAQQITFDFARKMNQEYKLDLFIHHATVWNKVIESITVNFISNENPNIEQARKIILPCIQKFVDEINNDKLIRPHLTHYPFTAKDIVIGIAFFDKNDDYYTTQGNVGYVCIVKGKIFYQKVIPPKELLRDMHEETFEEAKKIVNNQF